MFEHMQAQRPWARRFWRVQCVWPGNRHSYLWENLFSDNYFRWPYRSAIRLIITEMQYLSPEFWNQKLQHRHLITFILFLVIIFQCILIAGCVSSSAGGPNLYLIQLKYSPYNTAPLVANGIVNPNLYRALNRQANATDLVVRTGYFGICAQAKFLTNDTSWKCTGHITALTQNVKADQDPFNLIYVGFQFMTKAVAPWLLVIATIMTAFTAVSIHFVKDTGGVGFSLVVGVSILSFLLCLIGMVWQQSCSNTTAVMITALSDNAIQTHSGPATAGLGWTSTLFLFGCSFGLVMMYLSERKNMMLAEELETAAHPGPQPII